MSLAGVLGALSVPRRAPALVVQAPPRWLVATFLAPALRGTPGARAIGGAARQFMFTIAPVSIETCDIARSQAILLRDRVAALPRADQAPVMLATLRELLTDAPTDDAVALDRSIVAAARTEGVDPTAAQTATAAGIVAEIMRAPEGVMGRHRASIVGGAAWEVRGELARGYAVRVQIEGGE